MEIKILESTWLLPVTGPPIKNGGLLIVGNKIEKILRQEELSEFVSSNSHHKREQYEQSIIVPGFINLHTHLEYTSLHPLPAEGGLFDWLPKLMSLTANWSNRDRSNSIQQGVREIIASGTTFVVDNSYNGASARLIAESGLRALIGIELFGVDQTNIDGQWQGWQKRLQEVLTDPIVAQAMQDKRIDVTVAPHAPYTVCPALWQYAKKWADANNQIVLTHLAESVIERSWFDSGDNKLTDFLINAFGKFDANFANTHTEKLLWKENGRSPVKHLHKHGLLGRNLLAGHTVNVDDEDIELLKSNSVAIAHCPRSNQMLGSGRAPLGKFLDNELRLGFGTDSKASNCDLDLLAELRFAVEWHQHQEIPLYIGAQKILESLTIKAAACLNRQQDLGSLEPGKTADLAVFVLPKNENHCLEDKDPLDLLLDGGLQSQALFVDGLEIHSNHLEC